MEIRKNRQLGNLLAATLILASRFVGIFPANVSPVGSLGFFSRSLPLLALTTVGFDLISRQTYKGAIFTYLGFASYVILGKIIKKDKKKALIAIPFASMLFFFISNFGVWYIWYDHTIAGLIQCYTLALPFLRNTLIGDISFGYGFLALQALVKKTSSIRLKLTAPQVS